MGRIAANLHPFRYPSARHVRRHGPAGYQDYRDYRPWLDDEFTFRCVYCLMRQRWAPTAIWSVDHLVPQRDAPELECSYDNLVLTCQSCNNKKLANRVPDPAEIAYGNSLQVDEDTAEVRPLNKDGEILLRVLKLNHSSLVTMRRDKIRALKILARHSPEDWKQLMGFPESLPNLRRRNPPGGNSREGGIADSWFEKKQAGTLPEAYE